MQHYCNLYEWGTGISGRHPFGGKMGSDDIEAFANIALSGDLSGQGNTFDHGLAADYLRLYVIGYKECTSSEKKVFSLHRLPTVFCL